MKFAEPRPYANPEVTARKLIEIANAVEAVQDGPDLHRTDQRPDAVRAQGDAGGILSRAQVRDRSRAAPNHGLIP